MRQILASVACLLVTACVNTQIASQRLPGADANLQPFKSVLTVQADMSLINTQRVEKIASERLAELGVTVFRGTTYIPYDASPEEIMTKATSMKEIDGLLVIAEESSEYITKYIPPEFVPETTSTRTKKEGNEKKTITTVTPAHTVPGYEVRLPQGAFSAHLYDMRMPGKSVEVWLAEITSEGAEGASMSEIFDDIAKQTVKKLLDDGLIEDAKKRK